MLLKGAPSDTTLLVLSALSGVVFHHGYARRVEIDFNVWRLLGIGAIQCIFFGWWSVKIWELSLASTLQELSFCLFSFILGLTSSILIYRGYFHRLGKFPGPFAARLSSFWTVRKSSGEFKFHRNLEALHRQYGDFVRIGPRLLSINRADALPELMALNKGVWWSHTGNDHTKLSFSLSRSPEDHKQRRRPWEQAFSTQSLEKFDDDIQEIIGIFIQQTKEQETIDVPAAMGRTSFDVMGLVGFGRSFDNTIQGVAHPALVAMRKAHYVLGSLRWVPWLMLMLSHLPGGSDFVPFLDLCANVVHDRQAQYKSDKNLEKDFNDRKDVMAYLLDAMNEGGPAAPPTQEAMNAESRVMIAAGADTTQSVLANMMWYLAASPSALRKLQGLLDAVFPEGPDSFSYNKLIGNSEAVEWTDAFINETMRLRPAGISGNPRTTGPEGLIIPKSEFGPEVWVPGGVDVLAPTWVIHRDERCFGRADEFIPDRWISDSAVLCDKRGHFPFSIGKHACVGKPLAVRELRSMLARVALTFDVRFPENCDSQSYEQTIMDAFTMTLPPFSLVFKERNKAK
ncbi:hypothetical protein SUNI508_04530 [Seiridium unicorne]|uniref:Cytochrome P450 n=1 Tax=Seiridium unicorne TaxID=138068 RepID=A0ABR2V8B7_9PEZI